MTPELVLSIDAWFLVGFCALVQGIPVFGLFLLMVAADAWLSVLLDDLIWWPNGLNYD